MSDMATEKQLQALENMVENGGNISKAMRDAGYSPATAHTPSKLTDSKGFQELADSYLPDHILLNALSADINEKVGNRKAELELAFKIKGRMIERQDITSGDKPIPLLNAIFTNNSDQENSEPIKED